jgi:hypothetical protein
MGHWGHQCTNAGAVMAAGGWGQKTKISQFQEVAGALQEFKTYLFIKPGSAFCTVVHSSMKFMAISEATQHLQGRFIVFIKDCTPSQEPTPVLFLSQKRWQWVTVTVATHGPSLLGYYKDDPSWCSSLWTPAADCKKAETILLRLLHIPLVLFELIRKEGCPLMPHKILTLILKHVKNVHTDQEQATVNTWQLVMRWCVMAAQKDQQGDSFVLFSIEAIMEGDDAYFGQWMENPLDSTIGTWPETEPHTGAPGVVTTPPVPAHFAAELGKRVALGL